MFKRVLGNPRPKSSARNIVATPAGKHLTVWITSKHICEYTQGRNRTNVPAARNVFKRSRISTNIWKPTTSELLNARSLVVHVAKHFTTSHLTTLMFAPRIQLHSPLQLVNAPPLRKPQTTHPLQKNLRGRTKQVQIQRQNHQPLLKRQLLPLVLAGKRIPFSSLRTLFPVVRKTLLTCTDSTGHKSGPDSAARTDYKTGTIFACPRSIPQASANNSAASFLISLPCLKSTLRLVLFCAIQKLALSSTTTLLPITTWY